LALFVIFVHEEIKSSPGWVKFILIMKFLEIGIFFNKKAA
tara:strand:+ start:1463 stop:1582 length:120 start_codon:yes stop_codon:yes gene_type:complete